MKNLTPPEIAEYASLAGSALGTIAAVASGQVVYAAAPLTVALSLNLVNRNRSQQQTQQFTTEAIAKAYHVIQSLHQQVQALPHQGTIAQIKDHLHHLSRRFDDLPTPQVVDLTELEIAIAQLTEQLSDLNQQFHTRPERHSIQQLESANVQLRVQLNALTLRLDTLPTPPKVDVTGVETALALLTEQVKDLHQKFHSRPETQAIGNLSTQLNDLTQRFDSLPTSPELNLTGIEAALAMLTNQLNVLHQQFHTRAEVQAIEHLEIVSAQLRVQLNALLQRFENMPTPPKVDLSGIEAVIEHIKGQLYDLNQQFHTRPELQAILQLESASTQLRSQLNTLTQRLDTLPIPPDVDLSEIETAIAQLNEQLDGLDQQFNNRVELQAIQQLETESTQLRDQLNALTLRLDTLPIPPEADLTGVEDAIARLNDQLNALTLRFEHLPTPSEVDLTGIEDAISTLQARLVPLTSIPEQIIQLQTDLQLLQEQIDQEPWQSSVAEFSLPHVEELKKELEQLRKKFQIVTTLNLEINDLKQRLQGLDQIGAISQLLEAIPGLKEAVATLRMLSGNWNR